MASTTSSSRRNNLQLALEEAYRCVPALRYALFSAFMCDRMCIYLCFRSHTVPVRPSHRMMDALGAYNLSISDLDVCEKEIPPLCRFLLSKQAITELQIISLSKSASPNSLGPTASSSSGHTHRHNRRIVNGTAANSSFGAHNQRLLKAIFEFVGNARALHSFLMDSIDVGLEMFFVLGRSLASALSMRWFSIKNVAVKDAGFRLLTHALSTLTLQVLILENCDLTDDSCKYLSTIIKVEACALVLCYCSVHF
jgi:hypothetical protein